MMLVVTRRVGLALTLMLLGALVLAVPAASGSISVNKGRITINVSCAAGSARSCQGVVSLHRTLRGHTRTLGKRRYSAAPGSSSTVRVKLNKLGRRLFRERKALGATLRWTTSGAPTLRKSVRLIH
jgi:hypothetical protein